jgi:hypothetical protein
MFLFIYIKGIVRQVGYLLELYQDARSPEYKIFVSYLVNGGKRFLRNVPVSLPNGTVSLSRLKSSARCSDDRLVQQYKHYRIRQTYNTFSPVTMYITTYMHRSYIVRSYNQNCSK